MNKNLSIVVIVKNGEHEISMTLQSIREQRLQNLELIIIDGKSTDGTIGVVQKFEDVVTCIVSEPDKGHYDAYNKGRELATGDFILYLNCGDRFSDKNQVKKAVSQILYKDQLYFSRAIIRSGKVVFHYPPYRDLGSNWHKKNLPNMQTMFFPKMFYESHSFNLQLRLTADDDFKLHAIKKLKVNFIDTDLIEFNRDGISSNHKSFKLLLERIRESLMLNLEHSRYFRLFLDPLKRILMYLIHSIFGDEKFIKFIKFVKR